MKEKLTLSIDEQTKKQAKHYAKVNNRSISEMVESFLNALTADEDWEPEEGTIIAELAGSLPLDDKRSYREIIAEERFKKYEVDESAN